jgi:DNA-binding FadR family transcriptional regulator
MKHKAVHRDTGREARKVRSPKLGHLVAERLRHQIATGEVTAGDTLPSEAALLEQFGVSRPTLREALRVLESETLIELGRGSRRGAKVLGPSIEAIAHRSSLYLAVQGTTMGELHQVRMLLEPPITALLARRSRKDFIRVFQRCAQQQAEALKRQDYAGVLAAITEYHDLLVTFSENRALSLLAGILHEISVRLQPQIMLVGDRRSQRRLFAQKCEMAVAAYKELTRLLAAGKAAEAEKLWRGYMASIADYLIESGMSKLKVRISPAPH